MEPVEMFVFSGNPDAKRLYDDLLSNYNKLVRPVSNVSEVVTVKLKLKLSQLIAVVSKSARVEVWRRSFTKNTNKNPAMITHIHDGCDRLMSHLG